MMDQNIVVLEISSDEDVDLKDHDERGTADGGDDWLSRLLKEVEKENFGDDSDDVVLVGEVSPLKKSKLKSSSVDLDDDCVVLDDDPDKPVDVRSDNPSNAADDSDDIRVVSEKGQVACRDYPHPRHLCIKFPYSATPNQNHCEQCYCYVCDSLAPCVYWGNGSAVTDHCHATDKDEFWVCERKNAKNGTKGDDTITASEAILSNRLPLMDHFQRPTRFPVQSHNQIPRRGPIYQYHTSANFRPPNIISQNPSPIFASSNKVHPNLVPQYLSRMNGARSHQNYNHRPVFKRPGSVGVATTTNRHPPGSYRGNIGNPIRQQQNYRNIGSMQPNAVNTSVSYPPQSQNYTFSTVNLNPQFDQPLPPQPQSQPSNLLFPNFQSHVDTNPNPNPNLLYHPQMVPSCQPSYVMPTQSGFPVSSQTQVDNPPISVSGSTQNLPQENQVQNPAMNPGFKDSDLSWPPGQHFAAATLEGTGPGLTDEFSLAVGSSSLADYPYDWIFENQPNEPGFLDVSNECSSDTGFIDTGPIFDF